MRTYMISIYLLAWGGFYLAISQLWSSYKYLWPQRIDATVDIDGEYLCIEGLTQNKVMNWERS